MMSMDLHESDASCSVHTVVRYLPMSRELIEDVVPPAGIRGLWLRVRYELHRLRRRAVPWLDFHWHDDDRLPHQHDWGRSRHLHTADDPVDDE